MNESITNMRAHRTAMYALKKMVSSLVCVINSEAWLRFFLCACMCVFVVVVVVVFLSCSRGVLLLSSIQSLR